MTIDDRHLAVSKVLVISWMDLSWFRSLQEWCHWLEPQLSTQRPAVPWTVLCLLVCLGHPLHRFIIGKVEWQTKFKIILQVFFSLSFLRILQCHVTVKKSKRCNKTKQQQLALQHWTRMQMYDVGVFQLLAAAILQSPQLAACFFRLILASEIAKISITFCITLVCVLLLFFSICGWAGNIWLGCKESQCQAEHLPHTVLFTGLWQCWHVWLRLVELLECWRNRVFNEHERDILEFVGCLHCHCQRFLPSQFFTSSSLCIYVYIFSQVLDGGMMKNDGYESQTSSDIHQRSSWNDHIWIIEDLSTTQNLCLSANQQNGIPRTVDAMPWLR